MRRGTLNKKKDAEALAKTWFYESRGRKVL
jgi:hypothetical protein